MAEIDKDREIPVALRGYNWGKVKANLHKAPVVSGDPYFDLWMALTDRLVSRRVGLGIHDLEDQPYADWFEDGLSPRDAASIVLEEVGFGE